MTDPQTLEGRELDVAVQEALGYAVEWVTAETAPAYIMSLRDYLYAGDAYYYSEADGAKEVPYYHQSVDAILSEVEWATKWPVFMSQAIRGGAVVGWRAGLRGTSREATGPTLAVALCRLLLLIKREEAKSDA